MQTLFYVSSKEQQLGPFTIQDVKEKLSAGELSPTDYIYLESVDDWVLLMEYQELAHDMKPTKPKKPVPKVSVEEVSEAPVAETASAAASEASSPSLTEKKEEWFVLKGKDRFGPFSYREIIRMLQEKQVFEFDYVWKAPMKLSLIHI